MKIAVRVKMSKTRQYRALLTSCILMSFAVGLALGQTSSDIPSGAASLAFVFDITGSMYDDLVQVIEGAARILATTLSRREKPLYNYVLVPFHDPGRYNLCINSSTFCIITNYKMYQF